MRTGDLCLFARLLDLGFYLASQRSCCCIEVSHRTKPLIEATVARFLALYQEGTLYVVFSEIFPGIFVLVHPARSKAGTI